MVAYLVCGWCLGEGCRLHGAVMIPCTTCNERGYKLVGEEIYNECEDELN